MDPIYLTVLEICGDYARLRSDAGEDPQTLCEAFYEFFFYTNSNL